MKKNRTNSFDDRILSLLKSEPHGFTSKELSHQLRVTKKDYHNFRESLERLKQQGKISKIRKTKKLVPRSQNRVIEGELRMNRGGFGFVHDIENKVDIFIGRDHLNTAFDLDLVEVKLYARSRGKNETGYVSQIIKRVRNFFVGTFHQTQYYGYVVPDDPKIYRDFFVPKEKQKSALNGQKVVVRLSRWETDHLNPEGEILEILGFPGEPGVDVAAVAYSFQISVNFPGPVEIAAEKIPTSINEREIEQRLDLRQTTCITIDPEDAKDFDDAVSLTELSDGNYELGVHIADVSHYVTPDTILDKEAFSRGTSVYLVDRVIPMLPEKLSNEVCSLQPDKDKLTYSCIMIITPDSMVSDYRIVPSVIRSKKRFTYEEVQHIADKPGDHPLRPLLLKMLALSKKITAKRFADGGIDFETPEVSFKLDAKGFPESIRRKERLDSHRMIEEFMLLANKTVAQHIKKISEKSHILPFIYRVHEKPDPEKTEKFFEFLKAIGVDANPPSRITSGYFQNILENIKGTPEEIIIEEVALRSMMKAVYSVKNIGHFGLGFEDYTHFTSPIRRYPDLAVHRLLKRYAKTSSTEGYASDTGYLSGICEQSSRMERIAVEAERESVRLKQNEYISQHIGEEFDGIISGVMSFGIFVELVDTLVEGLVHIRDMSDYYIYDEKTYTLTGRDSNRILRLGDTVRIRVAKVNLEEGKVDFTLLGD
jgi:ribonuclease R